MKKLLFLSLGAIALLLTGCHDDGRYGSGYGRSAVYYDDGDEYYDGGYYDGGSYGYGGYRGDYYSPGYTQVIYVEGRPYRYDHDHRLYHESGGRRVYMSDAQYARNRQAI